ncbi:hypothetical protein [Tardiphaga sp.]|uniref:hypothetical protein n=1 Tax=Tardiphaga sp. TaxID=1926292 RepID=UPI00352B0869
MQVVLLGAGASKSYTESPTGVLMPLALDFFQTFDKLKIKGAPWVLLDGLFEFLIETKGVDPNVFLRAGIDIELLHSEIESHRDEALKTNDPGNWMLPYKAFNELIFLFTAVLNEIQNGPISEAHKLIARHINPDDSIITFNWDTLMDRALSSETAWSVDGGYDVRPRKIFSDGWRDPNEVEGPRNWPNLIKLHGSTNWLTGYTTTDGQGKIVAGHDLPGDTLHIFEKATVPYPCYAGRYIPGYQPYSYGYYPPNFLDVGGRPASPGRVIIRTRLRAPHRMDGVSSAEGLATMPLIIPPVRNKSYEFFGSLFSKLWSTAERAIAETDRLLVIGYSFPKTDLQSINLFERAFANRTSIPEITIVDPAPQHVVQIFREKFHVDEAKLTVIADRFSSKSDFPLLFKGEDAS